MPSALLNTQPCSSSSCITAGGFMCTCTTSWSPYSSSCTTTSAMPGCMHLKHASLACIHHRHVTGISVAQHMVHQLLVGALVGHQQVACQGQQQHVADAACQRLTGECQQLAHLHHCAGAQECTCHHIAVQVMPSTHADGNKQLAQVGAISDEQLVAISIWRRWACQLHTAHAGRRHQP